MNFPTPQKDQFEGTFLLNYEVQSSKFKVQTSANGRIYIHNLFIRNINGRVFDYLVTLFFNHYLFKNVNWVLSIMLISDNYVVVQVVWRIM